MLPYLPVSILHGKIPQEYCARYDLHFLFMNESAYGILMLNTVFSYYPDDSTASKPNILRWLFIHVLIWFPYLYVVCGWGDYVTSLCNQCCPNTPCTNINTNIIRSSCWHLVSRKWKWAQLFIGSHLQTIPTIYTSRYLW